MKDIGDIRQIDFDQVNHIMEVDYVEEGIAFHTDIRELPIEEGSMRSICWNFPTFPSLGNIAGRILVSHQRNAGSS